MIALLLAAALAPAAAPAVPARAAAPGGAFGADELLALPRVEAPDLSTVAKVSVALSARGSTNFETLPALEIEEFLQTLE